MWCPECQADFEGYACPTCQKRIHAGIIQSNTMEPATTTQAEGWTEGEDAATCFDNDSLPVENEHFSRPQQTEPGPDEDMVTVELNAFLRNSASFKQDDELWICNTHQLKKMTYAGSLPNADINSKFFSASFKLPSSKLQHWVYKYIIFNKENIRSQEKIRQKDSNYRKFILEKRSSLKVLRQFDDICMKSERHYFGNHKTEIDDVRPKFLNTVLYYSLRCQDDELPYLLEKFHDVLQSINKRHIFDLQTKQEEKVQCDFSTVKIQESLEVVIKNISENSPISFAFAAALFIELTGAELSMSSVEKLASIAKRYSVEFTIPQITEPTKVKICSAVKTLFLKGCVHQCVSAVWLMGLFYKLLPHDVSSRNTLLPLCGSDSLNWISADKTCQSELLYMVQKHQEQLGQHPTFAETVLFDMFSVTTGYYHLLEHLCLEPKVLLIKTLEWIQTYPIEKLKWVISTVAKVLKDSLKSRSEISEEETMSCLSLTIAIIKKFTDATKSNDPSLRALKALELLNSFSGTLEHLQHNEELAVINQTTIQEVKRDIERSIQDATKPKELQVDFWKEIFGLRIPAPWQQSWEETLSRLFSETIKKANPKEQVNYYCNISDIDSVMEECLFQCAVESVKDMAENLKVISQSKKYGKPMSAIICHTWKYLKEKTIDWEYLLTDPHSFELLRILGAHQKDKLPFESKLTAQAQALVNNTKDLLRKLPCDLHALPSKLIHRLLHNGSLLSTCRLHCGDRSGFDNALESAKAKFETFMQRQNQSKALLKLCSGVDVDARKIKEALKVDLTNDEKPLDLLMELWVDEGKKAKQCISIQAFKKIEVAFQSRVFKKLWDCNMQRETVPNPPPISLHKLHEIYTHTIDKFTKTYEALRTRSMQVEEFDKIFKEYKVDLIEDELKVMQKSLGDSAQTEWITDTCVHIKRYRTLQDAVEPAKIIFALQEGLKLTGDFSPQSDFQDHCFNVKCLKDFTEEMETTGSKLKVLDNRVVSLLNELLSCAKKDFIDWIRSIIKDQKELTVFVELASAFAGENTMDIDKVRNFRDAVFACAPIIYDLDEHAGFHELMEKITILKESTDKDVDLQHKLRDSCVHKPWLEAAHSADGSIAKTSLLQATEINTNGVYMIKQSSTKGIVKLDDSISLHIGEKSSENQGVQYKIYNLSQLQELQNKLMLITATDEQTASISQYVEVLEQILHAGELLIKLTEAGHILFTDWALTAYCFEKHEVKVRIDFGLTGMTITGHGKLLEELTGVCKSMQDCLEKWLTYTTKHRDEYYFLNYFTAKQLVTLCCSVANLRKDEEVATGVLNMLSFIKKNVTEKDLRDAFAAALKAPLLCSDRLNLRSPQIQDYLVKFPELIEYVVQAGYTEDAAKAAVMHCKREEKDVEDFQVDEEAVMECVYEYSIDDDWVKTYSKDYEEERENVFQNQMKFSGGCSPEQMQTTFSKEEINDLFKNFTSCKDKITILWETYSGKLSGLVSDKYAGLDLVGETLKQLAETEEDTVQRKLTRHLERGRANLVPCRDVEMLPQCLSLYISEEQPLPTFDEILICTSETTAEDVELIIRRAVQPGSRHEKIYSLLNADKLNHEVSRTLELSFYHFSQSQDLPMAKDFNFVIFCNAKAHFSYVLTAFDEYRRAVPSQSYGEIQKLLREKHTLSSEVGFTSIIQEQFHQSIKMIVSARAGMGKTLFVNNLVKRSVEKLKGQEFTHKTISLNESEIKPGYIFEQLRQYEDKPEDKVPRLFHFDVPPVVCKGLYSFLVQLFVLRCFQSTDGSIWRCKDCHLYLVEFTERKATQREHAEMSTEMMSSLLEMFTTVRCLSPNDTKKHLSANDRTISTHNEFQTMDDSEFRSEVFQRPYQYLKRFQQSKLEQFIYDPNTCDDSPMEWLECILLYCEIKDPSWMELRNFTHFLNVQLEKCEKSVFCSDMLRNDLTGFRTFVVKFMITMSRDFTMPSLRTSDESDLSGRNGDEDILSEYQIERRWEQHSHPYIMFNADGVSMSFLGFHIQNLNAVDIHSKKVIEHKIITKQLLSQLTFQGVQMNTDFNNMARSDQLEILCRVLGVNSVKDPDESYQLTLDNILKILAIHMRFQCNIPVIIMGETGCGKTRLVQFMCDLLKTEKEKTNLIVVRVHGGTTSEQIYKKVEKAIQVSKENEKLGMDTVLFFDEANSTEAVYAIKEVICDRTANGCKIDAPQLKFVAACNPYRKHTQQTIEQLERAGLGYRVRAEDTKEKLGRIPMRQLVYRVQPLPPSLSPLVWDFGKLNEHTQELYITQMVHSFFKKENLSKKYATMFIKVISVSQRHIASLANECRMVSLRDIERCMKTVMWFYQQRTTLYPLIDRKKDVREVENMEIDDIIRSLILAVGVCYSASLEHREKYIEEVAKVLSLKTIDMMKEIDLCQEVFIDNVDFPSATAKNDALKENVFMMIVSMNLRLPLFLVGKPGSSKSLSKTIAADALQGKSSRSDLFKRYKQVQLLSFQCSAYSTSDGIISTFRQCAQLQLKQNLDEYVSVVVLDEIGLAEDSPTMPLKTLHPLLEGGYIDDEEQEVPMKVGFIGISNWSLDPAKMNRGILLLKTSPGKDELIKTAQEICKPSTADIEENIPKLTKVYSVILKMAQSPSDFYGLRDYYSLIKVIVTYARMSDSELSMDALAKAVQRNFGGLDSEVKALEIFNRVFQTTCKATKTIDLVKENLDTEKRTGLETRYLLLLTSNNAALSILRSLNTIDKNDTEIIFGSGFPLDQEYSQVCRTVNRVKTCMETGRHVVLLNIQSLYESLYDALNQCYVKLGGSNYVDIGLGSHRVKCKVRDEFRLIVIEEKSVVYSQFPAPLLSRLEKHCLEMSTILLEDTREMLGDLEKQVETMFSSESEDCPTLCDILIGFTGDSMASVLLQCCPQSPPEWESTKKNDIIQQAKEKAIQCATLDSILRVTQDKEAVQELYFNHQTHINLTDVIKKHRSTSDKGFCLEMSTYSRLLNQIDLKSLNTELNVSQNQSNLFRLQEFQTEQAFCDALRKWFQSSAEGRLLTLIQFYFENPKLSQRLLSCARYCISKLVREFQEKTPLDVILLIRIPRISGGCGYTALIGDDWDCAHLDELIPTKGLTSDMDKLCKMSIPEIFKESMESSEDCDVGLDASKQNGEEMVATWLLIKMSIQKAIVKLRDKTDNCHRAKKRIDILQDLFDICSNASKGFYRALEKRISTVLTIQETESKNQESNWVIAQAMSKSFVVEGTSFRHALWIQLEDTVASAMAQVLATADGDNNLDHVAIGQPSDKTDLWLEIFQSEDLLSIPVLSKSTESYSVLSTSKSQDKSLSFSFPFSWVVKARFDQIWKQVHDLPESIRSPLKQIQKCEEFIKFPWLFGMRKTNSLFGLYAEDLAKMHMPECPQKLNQSFSVVLVELAANMYKDLTMDDPENVTLLWLHVTYEKMHDNHQILYRLSQQCSDQFDISEASEATEATQLLLEKLQPSDELLKDYSSCKDWLKRVKMVSTTVELILSEDSVIKLYCSEGEKMIENIRMLWHRTQIVYLLMDNLLQDETVMEDKLLRIVTKNFILLWKMIAKKNMDMEQTFKEVTRMLKQCNNNACNIYLKGTIDCKSCGKEFTDPVELPCGHIFCKHCIDSVDAKKCFECNEPINANYKPCEPVKRKAILKLIKFRSHCNSFFVEFILKCCVGEDICVPDGVVNLLLDFVRGNPNKQATSSSRTSELSPFHECMDPSPAVQSLVLKILLRGRLDEMGKHLQRYIEEAVKCNENNPEEFYLMVVRSTEDQIQTSSHEAMVQKAIEYLSFDISILSSPGIDVTFEDLHCIAKIRFAVTVASDIIGGLKSEDVLDEGNHGDASVVVQRLKEIAMKNQWIQIFLIRNLCNVFGFKIIKHILQNKNLHWILPKELHDKKDDPTCTCGRFAVYGEMFKKIIPGEELKNEADGETEVMYPVCAVLAAFRQFVHNNTSITDQSSLIAQVYKEATQRNWKNMSVVCQRISQKSLAQLSEKLSFSHDSSLTPIVIHTAAVVYQSTAPEMELLKTLCTQPKSVMQTFLPTMPDIQRNKLELGAGGEGKLWKCKCGQPVVLEDCGRPWVTAKCPNCNGEIGGASHRPVEGFKEVTDADQMGHILGDPSSRTYPGCERSLSGASLCLVRALLHSCMLWAAIDEPEGVKELISKPDCIVGGYLCDHLQKDIELLASVLGKSTEDAEIAVHMFLRYLMESPSVGPGFDIHKTDAREKRDQWENHMQTKTRAFFLEFDQNLSKMHNDILLNNEGDILVNILYSKTPQLTDLPTKGIFNLPLMWRYEQRMTIQRLTHLVELGDGNEEYPVLLELLRKHGDIQHIRHLPQILSLQLKLMLHFRYTDLVDLKDLSVEEFLTKAPPAESLLLEEGFKKLMSVWKHVKDLPYLEISPDLRQKEEDSIKIPDFLPRENSLTQIITKYLAKMQNDCINSTKMKESGTMNAEDLKHSHVITCDLEEDFLPMAITNFGYIVNEDGTETTNYNFKTLENQLISRFISEKPLIDISTLPLMESNSVPTLQSFFKKVKSDLEPLSVQDKSYIMNEMRFLHEISAALSTLRIAIGFLELSFSSKDMPLVDYMKTELRMEDRAKHLELPVLETSQVKHIQSLWETLSTRRSALLTEMNQDPFFMVDLEFHEELSEDGERDLVSKLAEIKNMDMFLTELHDLIMNMKAREFQPWWPFSSTFEYVLSDEKELDEDSFRSLIKPFGEELEMKNVIALWKLAVQRRAAHVRSV
ncbi:E3 ubiquitin-protein ligase rnf213-alpha-like [Alosa pseudoharengus]|uniref:E3 ubiquitin-protein ligase rnf213-alpha-like n=1 Tax=Alosa pseudoharengus TaxID=34774 RepID=UPI003F8892F1